MAFLVFTDDLCRGARKRVIMNYVGTFGLVAKAVGAEIWSSGYYLTQRRFSLKGKMGRAHPRYHSLTLAGDIGLKNDLVSIRDAGLAEAVMTPTKADAVLRAALKKGKDTSDVPEWKYSQSNCSAAQDHYMDIVAETGAKLEAMSPAQRQEWVSNWLEGAVKLVGTLEKKDLVTATETNHQKVWLDVFREWSVYAKQ